MLGVCSRLTSRELVGSIHESYLPKETRKRRQWTLLTIMEIGNVILNARYIEGETVASKNPRQFRQTLLSFLFEIGGSRVFIGRVSRQCSHKSTGASDHLSQNGVGDKISITNRGCCEHNEPTTAGNRGESSVRFVALGKVKTGGKQNQSDEQEYGHQHQLVTRDFKCFDKNLQSRRVSCQSKNLK